MFYSTYSTAICDHEQVFFITNIKHDTLYPLIVACIEINVSSQKTSPHQQLHISFNHLNEVTAINVAVYTVTTETITLD